MRRFGLVAMLLLGCGGGDGDTIKIGMNASYSGELATFGSTAERVVRLAIADINARGGVDGRNLELVSLDDQTDSDIAQANTDALIERGDIAAMIGPVFSGASAASMPAIKANQLVSISGSATAASLVTADDDGYYFMDVPNDNFQAIAMGKYLMEIADPVEDHVALVYQTDPYGEGLAASFTAEYTSRGGVIVGTATFEEGLAAQVDIDTLWAEIVTIVNQGAPMVVLITFAADGVDIVAKWDDSGDLPTLRWFFTDGVRDSNFVQSRPTALEGMRGTAPTHANNTAFTAFADEYRQTHGTDITQDVFQANYYDATYLLALALSQQAVQFPGEPLGGPHLRDALFLIAGGDGVPATTIVPADYAAGVAALAAGMRIDYDGASGPCNFDPDGQAVGPIEVWQIVDGLYVQDQYFETTSLVAP